MDHLILTRSGEKRWINDSSIQVYDQNGAAIGSIGILQDVTERKEAERLLEERVQARTAEIEQLLRLQRALLDNAGFAIISAGAQGQVELFNPQAERMLGYSACEAAASRSLKFWELRRILRKGLLKPSAIQRRQTGRLWR